MKNLAPHVFRQRLLLEGLYTINVTREVLDAYLRKLAEKLAMRIYSDPIIFSPSSGMGKDDNQGFDAFVPLIDSGISAYVWSAHQFFSIVIYTCKGFSDDDAIAFTKDFFKVKGDIESLSF
jgi:hypothetical protein